MSSDLTWTKHIEEMCVKENKTLGLIKRVCGRAISETDTRKLLYCALVRPRLEYASNVWSPYTAKHRRLIENVQRRATKFVLNYPPRETSYTDRLAALDLLPLEYRREISDLVLLFKYRIGLINAAFNKNFVPFCHSYNTRNFDQRNCRAIHVINRTTSDFPFFLDLLICGTICLRTSSVLLVKPSLETLCMPTIKTNCRHSYTIVTKLRYIFRAIDIVRLIELCIVVTSSLPLFFFLHCKGGDIHWNASSVFFPCQSFSVPRFYCFIVIILYYVTNIIN